MEQSQSRHFPSRAREGAEAMVMPAGDHRARGHVQEVEGRHSEAEGGEEYRLNCMGEIDDDEDEDDDNKGNAITHPTPALVPEEIIKEEAPVEMVPELEAPMAHEVIMVVAESEPPHPHLFNMIMRNYEKSPLRMENGPQELGDLVDLDDLEDDRNEGCSDMDEWFPEDGSNDRD
jgi:hypothetical protein